MREIKFRCWDEDHMERNVCACYKNLDKKEITLMQYTGLKDKNGKKIYEGDIVEWVEDYLGEGNILKYKSEVSFGGGSFIISGSPLSEFYKDENSPFEVIGNIYKNPELDK